MSVEAKKSQLRTYAFPRRRWWIMSNTEQPSIERGGGMLMDLVLAIDDPFRKMNQIAVRYVQVALRPAIGVQRRNRWAAHPLRPHRIAATSTQEGERCAA